MSEIIEAIRYCFTKKSDSGCSTACPAWIKENYICDTVNRMERSFAEVIVSEHDSLVAENEKLSESVKFLSDKYAKRLEAEADVRRLKRIMKDISRRMECNCGDMDFDCMPCDRCILKKESEAKGDG